MVCEHICKLLQSVRLIYTALRRCLNCSGHFSTDNALSFFVFLSLRGATHYCKLMWLYLVLPSSSVRQSKYMSGSRCDMPFLVILRYFLLTFDYIGVIVFSCWFLFDIFGCIFLWRDMKSISIWLGGKFYLTHACT